MDDTKEKGMVRMTKRGRWSRGETMKEKLHMARFLSITDVSPWSIPQPSLSLLSWHLSIKLALVLQTPTVLKAAFSPSSSAPQTTEEASDNQMPS